MRIGMLWADFNSKTSLADKIAGAIAYYKNKYGSKPDTCIIHPSMSKEDGCPDGIQLKTSRMVLPNHFLIGIEDPKKGGDHVDILP